MSTDTEIMLDVLSAQPLNNKVDYIHDVIIEYVKRDSCLLEVSSLRTKGIGGAVLLYNSNLNLNATSNGGETFEYCQILFHNDPERHSDVYAPTI